MYLPSGRLIGRRLNGALKGGERLLFAALLLSGGTGEHPCEVVLLVLVYD